MSHAEGDEIVPGFRLVKFLGRGGIGEVWKATAPGKMFCALKIINLSAKQGRTEYRAVKLVKNIHHPHLVPMTGIWLKDRQGKLLGDEPRGDPLRDSMAFQSAQEAPAQMIIQMGLGDESLHDRLSACQRKGQQGIPPDELLDYMEEAAKGIDFLNTARHDLGRGPEAISHGDIKPQNIMLVGGSAQVCDFGLARSLGADVRATSITGSPAYGSPESLSSGKNVPTSDQYSLAISYFELRTGRLPFDDESYFSVIAAHTKGKLNLQALPSAEREVIARATALEPAARFESCVKMVRELRRAYEGSIAKASVVILAEATPSASASDAASPSSVAMTPPPRSVLETGRELLPHLKLVRRMFKVGVDEIWEATSSSVQTTLFIRDLAPPAAPPDLRTLGLMSRLEHPHLARLLSFWLFDRQLTPIGVEASSLKDAAWLVLSERRVERTLGDRLEECRAEGLDGIPPDELLGHMLGAAQAIDYLNTMRHEIGSTRVGVQHGHVRPSSLELHASGDGLRVRLGNFTHARILDAEAILVPQIAAEVAHAYLAPERIDGHLSRWSDQFSLGVTYYHLRTGLPPHSPADLMADRIDARQLPAPEANVLLRATSFDLEQRYESCTEFVTLLGAAIGRATRQRLGRAIEPPKETGSLLAPGPLPVAPPPAPTEPAKATETPASTVPVAETTSAPAALSSTEPAKPPDEAGKKKKRRKAVEDDSPPLELTSTIEFNEAFRRMLSDSGPLAPLNLRAAEAKPPAAPDPTSKATEPEPARPALRTNSDWRARLKKGKPPHRLDRNQVILLAFCVAAVLLLFLIWLFSGPRSQPDTETEAASIGAGRLTCITSPLSSPPSCQAFRP